MIEIDSLTKTYSGDVQALRGLTLDIGSGMFGLLGPNGAGKTTLMRVIAGLLKPSSGSVRVLGEDITTQTGKLAVKSQLGYLPQELGLYPNLTGREFLDYISVLKGISDKQERARQVQEILDLVRLTDQADRRLKTYSGGMKRRIGIGQALLGYPKLLIVDEPTAGLDPEERVRFRNLLADMAGRCTVILSTHVIEDISHSCNDLAIIREGRVLFRGQPGELIGLARGRVWSILTSGERPTGDLKVVSTLQLQNGVQYRVIGMPDEQYQAQAVEPSLEDGYMLAMG
ncbi:MAG: ABC transporter ATP-binding protein [Chloroflexi bacterium]|uniref:ABC transporter ATP-binding protein n=1 Tax=Candidatus Flexifilum breve TaxID=3140694 RepID=UPI0031348081|nr:ABC transporter ATP-binding protein [Chloroflexota bacterium]